MDITRDGNSWATPQTVAARVDLHRALGAVRRAHDVGREVAEHQPQVLQALVESGLLFVPAPSVSSTVERLKVRGRGGMTRAGDGEVAALMDSMTSQIQHSRQATGALHSPRRTGASSTDAHRLRERNGPIR